MALPTPPKSAPRGGLDGAGQARHNQLNMAKPVTRIRIQSLEVEAEGDNVLTVLEAFVRRGIQAQQATNAEIAAATKGPPTVAKKPRRSLASKD
jgi:hypothetical protein